MHRNYEHDDLIVTGRSHLLSLTCVRIPMPLYITAWPCLPTTVGRQNLTNRAAHRRLEADHCERRRHGGFAVILQAMKDVGKGGSIRQRQCRRRAHGHFSGPPPADGVCLLLVIEPGESLLYVLRTPVSTVPPCLTELSNPPARCRPTTAVFRTV